MQIHPFKQYRIDHKIKQKELASILGLSVASVCRIERFSQAVTIAIAERAEKELGISRIILLYPNSTKKNNSNTITNLINRAKKAFHIGKTTHT